MSIAPSTFSALLTGLLLLWFSSPLPAAEVPSREVVENVILTLFVDANGGDDANDGHSPATALRSLNALQRKLDEAPEEGRVVVNLARGSVWKEENEQLPPGEGRFGRSYLTIQAYGEGERPLIDNLEPLPNEKFNQPDPEAYTDIWSIRFTPPEGFVIRYHDQHGIQPAVLVDEAELLVPVYTPVPEGAKMRDYHQEIPGIETEEDGLRFVQEHPGTFFVKDHGDGSYEYFLHSGSNPQTDGRRYTYRVRSGSFRALPGNRWSDYRILGLANRNGIGGQYLESANNVEVHAGLVHNMLISDGHFQDVVSSGLLVPDVPIRNHGATGTAFHTHGLDSPGLIYDRCIAKNVSIPFFDHRIGANRPAMVLRDCQTINTRDIVNHGVHTAQMYMVGHRHEGIDGAAHGTFGVLAVENFIEDSTFRLRARSGCWGPHPNCLHFHIRNSVLFAAPESSSSAPFPLVPFRAGADFFYDQVTLVLDMEGEKFHPNHMIIAALQAKEGEESHQNSSIIFRDCVIAIMNAPEIKTSADAPGDPVLLFQGEEPPAKFRFENCVLTYVEGIPAEAGVEGKDYVFAAYEEIFEGDPSKGDYRVKPDGPAGKRDAGYREDRKPIFRAVADHVAESMPYPK